MLGIKVSKCMLHNAIKSSYSAANLLSESNRQRTMECMKTPMWRSQSPKKPNIKHASVLIAICVNSDPKDELSILYTKRSATLSRHTSQVSFPGGLREEGDSDVIDCALRECEEEIGLMRKNIDVWGAAGCIRNSGSSDITPVVGVVKNLNIQNLVLNTDEVAEAFTIPLHELLSADNLHYTQFRNRYSVPVFTTQPHRVWGLTAYMTFNFLSCLLPPGSEWHQYKSRVQYIKPYKPPS